MSIKTLAGKIGMDYESVIEDFCGDVSSLKDALKAFASSGDGERLGKAVAADDAEAVRKEAHRIRKSAEKLGLEDLRKAAARLEEASEDKTAADYAHLAALSAPAVRAIEEEGL